jgi:heterodisulfide reductase subunit A-like polyferredoxin
MRNSIPVMNTLLVHLSVQKRRCSIISATRYGDAKCRNVVILGGGIIGASTAYYLSKRGVACTIIERSSVASAASGDLSRSSSGSCTLTYVSNCMTVAGCC